MAEILNPGAQGTEPPADPPKYATVDDLAKLARRFDAYAAESKKGVDAIASMTSKLDELLQGPPAAGSAGPGKPDAPAQSVEDTPQFKGLLKRLGELETRAKSAEETAASEKARARDADMRRRLADALAGHGIDGSRAKHAVGYLVDAAKVVRLADDGEAILFKDPDGGDLDLNTGLKGWIKTDDGKLYVPPRGAHGSGDRPAGTPAGKPGESFSREAVAEQLLSHLRGGPRPA